MSQTASPQSAGRFLKSLGFPDLEVHSPFNHYDFRIPNRRILVIGPMGSGKTEFSSRVWRDSLVVRGKSRKVGAITSSGRADRRKVFFVRSLLDLSRFPEAPPDALAYRGGYERLGDQIAAMGSSFDLEELLAQHPDVGTWILDEGTFYDERMVYVMRQAAEDRGLTFIFPTLILNFRREIFNSTGRLLLENATDVFSLTAYCDHPDCVEDSFFTYRYYLVDGEECPALYFDPLVIIGGDRLKDSPKEPNYCTRCDRHHHLPGKEYTFLVLKALGDRYGRGDPEPLKTEIRGLAQNLQNTQLYRYFLTKGYLGHLMGHALRVPCLAEKALIYLFTEMNVLREEDLKMFAGDLNLDVNYIEDRLRDNGRPVRCFHG